VVAVVELIQEQVELEDLVVEQLETRVQIHQVQQQQVRLILEEEVVVVLLILQEIQVPHKLVVQVVQDL
tara:strand:+ start:478 stop:684 length:207 start_codon:yes stop_codon:yes gene_type:complete